MNVDCKDIQELIKAKNLKVTPQRIVVLEAIYSLQNHPTAEQIIDFIHQKHPSIAVGTVYKTLDTFVGHGVIRKVLTDEDIMRYDGILEHHHHLYNESKAGSDYTMKSDEMLKPIFEKNGIEGYKINSITLHINGKSINK